MKLSEILKLETRIPLRMVEIDQQLLEDIKEKGIEVPIEIRVRKDGSRIVWDGLHRLVVARELGIEEIPVMLIEM